ncbi:MAG TPA: type III pantothenate kinase [Candidatus Acidoferrales bacterium]|nr:type III pantothenate kinase [Candidatus Acidoferrales bacterium]
MRLLLDLGNTRIKWAAQAPGAPDFIARGAVLHETGSITDRWPLPQRPDAVWLCSVADRSRTEAVVQAVGRAWGMPVHRVASQAAGFGVRSAYAEPQRMGADRWAALVGARSLGAGPVCILDLGTALTGDLLDAQGSHLGGIIAPGRHLLQQSLRGGTAQVITDAPAPAIEGWGTGLGRTTDDCVAWGVTHSVIGCCMRIVDVARARLGADVTVLLTGGDAFWAQPLLPFASRIEPDLVLRGLAVMADA